MKGGKKRRERVESQAEEKNSEKTKSALKLTVIWRNESNELLDEGNGPFIY